MVFAADAALDVLQHRARVREPEPGRATPTSISKVYFPRLIVPASAVVTAFVDFLVSCVVLAGMMAWFSVAPSWRILALPAVHRRGFPGRPRPRSPGHRAQRQVPRLPLCHSVPRPGGPVRVAGRASAAPSIREKLGDAWLLLYSLNPMVGVIDGFRWVHPRRRLPALPARFPRLVPGDRGSPPPRRLVFPTNGKSLRRHHLRHLPESCAIGPSSPSRS